MHVDVAPIDRFHAGSIGRTPAQHSVDVRGSLLEAMVEQQPIDGHTTEFRWRVDAGQHLLRLLKAHGAPTQARRFLTASRVRRGRTRRGRVGVAGLSVMAAVARRVPDGGAIAGALIEHRGGAGQLASMPADIDIAASLESKVVTAANAFLTWYESHHLEPDRSSWQPNRFGVRVRCRCPVAVGVGDAARRRVPRWPPGLVPPRRRQPCVARQ